MACWLIIASDPWPKALAENKAASKISAHADFINSTGPLRLWLFFAQRGTKRPSGRTPGIHRQALIEHREVKARQQLACLHTGQDSWPAVFLQETSSSIGQHPERFEEASDELLALSRPIRRTLGQGAPAVHIGGLAVRAF